MNYRYETTSVIGFIQQLASNMLSRGYYFYVTGLIPLVKTQHSSIKATR